MTKWDILREDQDGEEMQGGEIGKYQACRIGLWRNCCWQMTPSDFEDETGLSLIASAEALAVLLRVYL
jgi:hypothetical protein